MSLQKSPYECPVCGERCAVPSLAAEHCGDDLDATQRSTRDTTPTPATDPATAHTEAS